MVGRGSGWEGEKDAEEEEGGDRQREFGPT